MTVSTLVSLAACTSTFNGNWRETYESIETGQQKTRGTTSFLEASLEGDLGSDLAYRVGDRVSLTDQTVDTGVGKGDESRTLHQPAVETVLTTGPLIWTQTFELQDSSTTSDLTQDVDRQRTWLLEKLEWAPEEWPRLTASLDRRTDQDDLFTNREEIWTVLQLDDQRGPFEWLYAFETQTQNDHEGDSQRQGFENRWRGTWKDELLDGDLYSTVVVGGRLRRDTTDVGDSGSGIPPGEIGPVQGLADVDTTPAFGVLPSNPGLIDGDELTPVGVNIGGFVSGGQTYWNMGVGLGLNATVDKVFLSTADEVPDFLVSEFSFSVWTSNDNETWTLAQGSAPFTYDDVGRRFRLSIAPVTALYLKVVNEASPPSAPAVQVTEVRVFGPAGASSSSTDERNLYEHNVRASFNYRGFDDLSLTWDTFGQLAGTDSNGVTTRDETRLDNTLSALWAPLDRVDVNVRAENRSVRDSVRPDEDVTVAAGSIEYRPLDTLDVGASYTHSFRQYEPTGDYVSDAAQVRSTARLIENLEGEVSFEHIVQDDQGLLVETTRDIVSAGLIARLSPRLDMTLRWSDTAAELSGSGVNTAVDPSSTNWEMISLWRITDLLTTEVRLTWRDAESGTGLDENYRLSYLPLPDGSVDIQLDVLRRVDGLQELSTDQYSAMVQWLINPAARLTFTWGALIPEDEERTDLFTAVFNLRL